MNIFLFFLGFWKANPSFPWAFRRSLEPQKVFQPLAFFLVLETEGLRIFQRIFFFFFANLAILIHVKRTQDRRQQHRVALAKLKDNIKPSFDHLTSRTHSLKEHHSSMSFSEYHRVPEELSPPHLRPPLNFLRPKKDDDKTNVKGAQASESRLSFSTLVKFPCFEVGWFLFS